MTDDLGFQSCPICGVRGLHGCLGPQKTTTVDPFVPIDEADPSTDEGEARCRDCGESRSSWRHGMCPHNWTCDGSCVHVFLGPGGREYEFTTIQTGISEEQAAAIRAPLEAEVERLREALTDALDTLLDYVPQRAKPYRNGWVDEWYDLATPLYDRIAERGGHQGGRGMTDERQCAVCGVSVYYAKPFSGGWAHDSFAPIPDDGHDPVVEADPSTDEGEARKGHECDAWCVFQSWVSEIRGGASNTDDLGLRSAFDAIAAEAREPLEKRIRELEAQLDEERAFADQYKRHAETGRAEVERLREALRPLVAAYDGGDLECPHFHFCPAHRDRVRNGGPCNCGAGEIEAAIEKARALATPPSSTEGTE